MFNFPNAPLTPLGYCCLLSLDLVTCPVVCHCPFLSRRPPLAHCAACCPPALSPPPLPAPLPLITPLPLVAPLSFGWLLRFPLPQPLPLVAPLFGSSASARRLGLRYSSRLDLSWCPSYLVGCCFAWRLAPPPSRCGSTW